MKYQSNINDPGATWDGAFDDFGLDAHSKAAPTVGNRAINTIAENIHDRGEAGEGPDGAWERNAPLTIKRKGFDKPNFETSAMMSVEQITGEVTITRNEAVSDYGKDDECRKKAHWAHEGQSRKQIERPFEAITESDADEVMDGFVDDIVNFLARG